MSVPRIGARGAKHGTRSMYTYYGCRCDSCRAANTAYTSRWNKRGRSPRPLVPAAETHRRMDELKAIGVRPLDVARMLGYANRFPPFLLNSMVTRRNAERMRVLHVYLMRQHAQTLEMELK